MLLTLESVMLPYRLKESEMNMYCNPVNMVDVATRRDGTPILMECGTQSSAYGFALCDECEKRIAADYPQGFRYYPGDTCKHGVYVGGCGADYMCGACEMGEDDNEEDLAAVENAYSESDDEDLEVFDDTEDYNSMGDYDNSDPYDIEYDRY